MIKVLITLSGGVIRSVTSTEEIEYLVVDHDNIDDGDDVPTMNDFVREDFIRNTDSMKYYPLNAKGNDNVRITSDDNEILEIENHNIIDWNFK